jgi:hypothetical protein
LENEAGVPVLRFRLQGHDERLVMRTGQSEGHLIVTYVPK